MAQGFAGLCKMFVLKSLFYIKYIYVIYTKHIKSKIIYKYRYLYNHLAQKSANRCAATLTAVQDKRNHFEQFYTTLHMVLKGENMDKQLDKAIMNFYSDLRGIGTEELYAEYLFQCVMDEVKPRSKSIIIREACEMTECAVEKQQRVIVDKFFVPKEEDRRQEWRNHFRDRKKG